jgi:hypothetical protein
MIGTLNRLNDARNDATALRDSALEAHNRIGGYLDDAQQARDTFESLRSRVPGRSSFDDLPSAPSLDDLPDAPEFPDLPVLPDLGSLGDFPVDRPEQIEDPVEELYADVVEEAAEPVHEPAPWARDEEQATAVLRVCRNGWNTVDTRPLVAAWFSA